MNEQKAQSKINSQVLTEQSPVALVHDQRLVSGVPLKRKKGIRKKLRELKGYRTQFPCCNRCMNYYQRPFEKYISGRCKIDKIPVRDYAWCKLFQWKFKKWRSD